MAPKGPGAGADGEMTLTLVCGSDAINPSTLDRAETPRLWTLSESRGDKTLEDVPQNKRAKWSVERPTYPSFNNRCKGITTFSV